MEGRRKDQFKGTTFEQKTEKQKKIKEKVKKRMKEHVDDFHCLPKNQKFKKE